MKFIKDLKKKYKIYKERFGQAVDAFLGYEEDPYFDGFNVEANNDSIGIDENGFHVTGHNYEYKDDGKRVGLKRMQMICENLHLQMVPIEEVGYDLPSKYASVEDLLARADGEYPKGGRKEGIVIRPTEPVYSELISGSLSMKVVSNKYLLKND